MCEWGNTVPILVKIPADLSCTGKPELKQAQIDRCIAPIVNALEMGHINMRGSCCGHRKAEGYIHLQDGRYLLILENRQQALLHRFGLQSKRRENKMFIQYSDKHGLLCFNHAVRKAIVYNPKAPVFSYPKVLEGTQGACYECFKENNLGMHLDLETEKE